MNVTRFRRVTERNTELKILGFALLVLGLGGVVFGGIDFDRQRTIDQIGSMSTSATQTNPVVPVAGVLSMGGGVAILLLSQKRRRA
jgi:hypothetical protein